MIPSSVDTYLFLELSSGYESSLSRARETQFFRDGKDLKILDTVLQPSHRALMLKSLGQRWSGIRGIWV